MSFVMIALMAITIPTVSAQTSSLSKSDFQQQSFAKTVDYLDYVRAYAAQNNLTTPANFNQWQANMYMTYVNTSGLQMLYAGLDNITTNGQTYLRIPAQSILLHYKTGNSGSDVITASTFLMLMAFSNTASSRFPNSPDVGDNLYASFSLGFDLSSIGATLPSLNSHTQIIPLTSSDNGLQWTWGMTYTNLTAEWWKTTFNPAEQQFDNSLPFAVTTYDQLTFKYTLTIDPSSNQATLSESHTIGRMRDLIIGSGLIWVHLNSTGTYGLLGRKISDQTVYGFLNKNQIKMSVVDYQTSVLANHNTYSVTSSGENVTGTDASVSGTVVNTYTDDGEKISSLDFGANPTYNLYNYTADPTQTTYDTYNAVTRTANATGFAANTNLLKTQIELMKFLPLVVAHIYPGLYQKAEASLSDMTKANYFYLTSYPVYSGYRIVQDPTLTVYMAPSRTTTTQTATPTNHSQNGIGVELIAISVIAIIIVIAAVTLALRRKPKTFS
jgi:hypothetical protein